MILSYDTSNFRKNRNKIKGINFIWNSYYFSFQTKTNVIEGTVKSVAYINKTLKSKPNFPEELIFCSIFIFSLLIIIYSWCSCFTAYYIVQNKNQEEILYKRGNVISEHKNIWKISLWFEWFSLISIKKRILNFMLNLWSGLMLNNERNIPLLIKAP